MSNSLGTGAIHKVDWMMRGGRRIDPLKKAFAAEARWCMERPWPPMRNTLPEILEFYRRKERAQKNGK